MTGVDPVEPALVAKASHADGYRARGWWTGERIVDRFRALVEASPGHLAVVDNRGGHCSRSQLWEEAGGWRVTLAESGVEPGQVVMLFAPNRLAWHAAFLGILRHGVIPATIPVTTDDQTLAAMIDLIGATVVVAAADHRGKALGEIAVSAAERAARPAGVLLIDDVDGRRWAVAARDTVHGAEAPAEVDHILFTSSTTGRPKAVMHTADTLAAVNLGFADRFGLRQDTAIFMASPLGHSVGAWHGTRLALFSGAPLVLQDRWEPEEAIRLIDDHGCAFTAAATPFLKDFIDAPRQGPVPKLTSMTTFLCGGAPVPPALVDQARSELPNTFVSVLWGMTEGGVTTCLPRDPPERVTATAGTGLPGLELRTVDDDGAALPPRTEGELAMRGPGVFIGYLGQPDLYRSLLTTDGFFRTGDLARIGPDGYLRITGRLKDLIIRGGVNISPVPVEDALAGHPRLDRVAVIGEPDARLGERICVVVVASGDPPDLTEMQAWLQDHGVPKRMWPESLHVVQDMPTTAAGKIRKVDLRNQLFPDQKEVG